MSLIIAIANKGKNGMHKGMPMGKEDDASEGMKEEDMNENEESEPEEGDENVQDEEKKYESNAKFEHYRSILAEGFRKKYPQQYDKFMTGLMKVDQGDPSFIKEYVRMSPMSESLSEKEVKSILGKDFQDYASIVPMVSEVEDLSFGKDLLAMPVSTSYEKEEEDGMYYYEPKEKSVQKMVKKK